MLNVSIKDAWSISRVENLNQKGKLHPPEQRDRNHSERKDRNNKPQLAAQNQEESGAERDGHRRDGEEECE